MSPDHPAPPRLFYVEYKSAINGRVARFFVKIPYGVYTDGLYTLSETLARAELKGEIKWFRLSVARPGQITPDVRASLTRWYEAILESSKITKVGWT